MRLHLIRILSTSIQAMLASLGSMRIQEMGPYRAGLTIWHSITPAISFSVGRRNHMPIAASLPSHWLHQFLPILLRFGLQSRMPKPLIILLRFRLCLRSRISSFPSPCTHYGPYSFDNSLFRHLRTSHWSLITRRPMNPLGGTLGTLGEGFSRICMLVWPWDWI